MKRVFSVVLSNSWDSKTARWSFEVIAPRAQQAIDKALVAANKGGWRSGWVVESLTHRGPAV